MFKLNIHPDFYYSKNQEKPSYSAQPEGPLDPDRLGKMLPPFLKPHAGTRLEKKTLIIIEGLVEDVYEGHLEYLLRQGFNIGFWLYSDVYFAANREEINFYVKQVIPNCLSPQALSDEISQKLQASPDTLQFISSSNVDQYLIKGEENNRDTTINFSEKQSTWQAQLQTFLLNKQPCEVNLLNLSNQHVPLLPDLSSVHSLFLFGCNTLSYQSLEALFAKCTALKFFYLFDSPLSLITDTQAFPPLHSFRCATSLSLEQLTSLLQKLPFLRDLYIKMGFKEAHIPKIVSPEFPELSFLANIHFELIHFSLSLLSAFLQKMPKLRKITLQRCTLSGNLPPEAISHPHLRHIDIVQCPIISIQDADLKRLAPNAKIICQLLPLSDELPAPQKEEDLEPSPPVPHNTTENLNSKPPEMPPENYKMHNKGKGLSQTMVIDKYLHYCCQIAEKKPDAARRLFIKEGICKPLSKVYEEWKKTLPQQPWNAVLTLLQKWHGEVPFSPFLKIFFDCLTQTIDTRRATLLEKTHYIDSLPRFEFFLICFPVAAYYIKNPWHHITLSKIPDGTWEVYDPNHSEGAQRLGSSLEQLFAYLRTILGPLISIAPSAPLPEPLASQAQAFHRATLTLTPALFIKEGGLLTLWQSSPTEQHALLQSLMQKMQKAPPAVEDLNQGLSLRTTAYLPFWFRCLEFPSLEDLVIHCLVQSTLSTAQFEASLSALTPEKLPQVLTAREPLERRIHSDARLEAPLIALHNKIREWQQAIEKQENAHKVTAYKERFLSQAQAKTVSPPPTLESLEAYAENLLREGLPKHLIVLQNSRQIEHLRHPIQALAKHFNFPCCYIPSREALGWSTSSLVQNPHNLNQAQFEPKAGGLLYGFLFEERHAKRLLIINFADDFSTQDLGQLNSLLDNPAMLQNKALPQPLYIIGLIDKPPGPHTYGEDFTGRFTRTTLSCPVLAKAFEAPTPWQAMISRPALGPLHPIHCYQSLETFKASAGTWQLSGTSFGWQGGPLTRALQQGGTVVLHNPPNSPELRRFFTDLSLYGHTLSPQDGKPIPVNAAGLSIKIQNTYDWDALTEVITQVWPERGQEHFLDLNPSTFITFFEHLELNEHYLYPRPGAAKPVSLNFEIRPGGQIAVNLKPAHAHLNLLLTRPLTEAAWAELLTHFKNTESTATLCLSAGTSLPPSLSDSLQDSGKRILKMEAVHTRPFPISSLAPLYNFIDVSDYTASDLLPSISPAPLPGASPHIPNLRFQNTSGALYVLKGQQKRVCLVGRPSPELQEALKPHLPQLAPFVQTNFAESPPPLSVAPEDEMKDPSPEVPVGSNSQDRTRQINTVLLRHPLVIIRGLTGVGKSTFIQQEYLKTNPRDKLFIGSDDKTLIDWLTDRAQPGGHSLLFIDEANLLTDYNWSRLETLFYPNPCLIIQGQPYFPSPDHKIICAANPEHYGNGRKDPLLFTRHPQCAITFDPLPWEVIEGNILNPLFAGSALHAQREPLCALFKEIYNTLLRYSQQLQTLFVTPREIKTLFLLVETAFEKNPQEGLRRFAIQLAALWAPDSLTHAFYQQFRANPSDSPHSFSKTLAYYFLASRQKQGALSGLILEGPPGVGKSFFLRELLKTLKYVEGQDFIYLPVGLPQDEKTRQFKQARERRLIVIMDEINTAPLNESEWNVLLDNGALVLGTQNPVHLFTGRKAHSLAVKRRFLTLPFPFPSAPELALILKQKGYGEPELQAQGFLEAQASNSAVTLRLLE